VTTARVDEGLLASLLRVERAGEAEFRASLRDFGGSAFGGDALGRAALAASATCEGKDLHSVHATFLRPLPAGVPLQLRVEALADGRRMARRRVEIRREERLLCDVTASFVEPAAGAVWQEVGLPEVPVPEALPSDLEVARREEWSDWDPEVEEWAWGFIGRPWLAGSTSGGEASSWRVWLRPRQPLTADSRLHAAALVYASDYWSQISAAFRLGRRLQPGGFVSLDHALRIHRPGPWDDWWLFDNWSEVAFAGRALWHRRVFTRDGKLVASVSQEGLVVEPEGPGAVPR
jgi:acyl-CoA thioesterase-2